MSRSAVAVRHVLFEDLGIVAPLLTERGYSIRYLGLTTPGWCADYGRLSIFRKAKRAIFYVWCGEPD